MSDSNKIINHARQTLLEADLLFTADEVDTAFARLACEISEKLSSTNPLILSVMIGGIVPTGRLLPHLSFPLQLDYIHATRYRSGTSGGKLHWIKKPEKKLNGRTILLIDDILDEGYTLSAIIDDCLAAGSNKIYTAVLIDKIIEREKRLPNADFTGLTVPDRYIFGCGMDYREYHRNCAGIYALNES
jgi:hypoxanthine phosphoribosyltransferase